MLELDIGIEHWKGGRLACEQALYGNCGGRIGDVRRMYGIGWVKVLILKTPDLFLPHAQRMWYSTMMNS